MLASYAGHLHHGLALRQWEEICKRYEWLSVLFQKSGWVIEKRWNDRSILRARTFTRQYWQLIRGANSDCLIFCQVGSFIEFYGPQRFLAAKALGLRSVAVPRGQYLLRVGFPTFLSRNYKGRALRQGFKVVDVRQVTMLLNRGLTPRLPRSLMIPTDHDH